MHATVSLASIRCMPLTLCVLAVVLAAPLRAADANLLTNGSFDSGFIDLTEPAKAADGTPKVSGKIGDGWLDNSDWADIKVVYAQEKSEKHGGTSAQKIEVKSFGSGAVQFAQKFTFKKGHTYAFSAWLRGTQSTPVEIVLRKRDAPYTTHVSTTATLSADWRESKMTGRVEEDGEGFVMFRMTAVAEALIDDVAVVDVTKAP